MRVGIVAGSGGHSWPGLTDPRPTTITTRFGGVEVTTGRLAGVEVVHLSRHGRDHARLSNHVDHRANLAALSAGGVDAVVSLTVCGAVDPDIEPGTLIAFDDLYFPGNRLPDGSLCTWHDLAAAPGRGHWIFDGPMCEPLRRALVDAARRSGVPVLDGGCYGHIDGPRFNTRAEVAALRAAGVAAVSQTAGPEVVLAGEAELPLALLGFVTDHANGVAAPRPVSDLIALMGASVEVFARVVEAALPVLPPLSPPGVVYRFGEAL
jgi:5'-methylthioadenosine phosphorylase